MELNGKISVIVPIYGVDQYLNKCIASICAQTYKNLEIFLVDDGSQDESGKICDEWAQKDSRIRVFHISNGGQSHARNVGLQHATGEYIGFVDGDDWIDSGMYEKMLRVMKKNQAEIVECNFTGRKSPEPDQMEDRAQIALTGRKAIERQLNQQVCSRYPSTSLWSKLFKTELIRDLRLPEGKIHEEYAFLCQAFLRCKKYIYCNEKLYMRTLREDSTTAEAFSLRSLDKLEVFKERNEVLQKAQEHDLYKLSRAWEFELMLHLFAQAHGAGLYEQEKELKTQMRAHRKEVLAGPLSKTKKLQYIVFWISPSLYLKLYQIKNR